MEQQRRIAEIVTEFKTCFEGGKQIPIELEVPEKFKYHKMIHEIAQAYGDYNKAESLTESDYWIFRGLEAQKISAEKWLMDQK